MLLLRYVSALILLLGCKKESAPMLMDETPKILTYLALGDSYTIGQSVVEPLRWPNQLVDSLEAKGIKFTKPRIVAKTGWRTDQLQTATDTIRKKDWNFVSLLIGVNDYYQNIPVQAFIPKFEKMLDSATSFVAGSPTRVMVLSIPDYGYTPYGQSNQTTISAGIALYNSEIERICEDKGVTFISISDISQQGLAQPNLVASDGLHPSGWQYSLWMERVAKSVFFDQYR